MTEEQKNNVKELVNALKSGTYKQGKSALASDFPKEIRYCCLGVACEIAIQHGLPVVKEKSYTKSISYHYNKRFDYLPEVVQEFFGFKTNRGDYQAPGSLAEMNDAGATFQDIAELIEKELNASPKEHNPDTALFV